MKPFFDIIARMIAAIVLMVMTTVMPSCTDEVSVPVPGVGVGGNANVGFDLIVSDSAIDPADSQSARSRAPLDGTYDPGSGLENYIDIQALDYHFYFFTNTPGVEATDNKFIGEIDIISFVQIASSPGMKRYTVVGSVPASLSTLTDYKVCVLANWKDYPVLAEGDDLSKLWSAGEATVYKIGNGMISGSALIPLYGIKEFSGHPFSIDKQTDLGKIHLLRAFAKVEVNLDKSVYPVEKVVLTRVNASGFKAPKSVDTEGKYVHDEYEKDYVNTPNIPAGVDIIENFEMHPTRETETQRQYIAYVPEYNNKSSDIKTRIRITYQPVRIKEPVKDDEITDEDSKPKEDDPNDFDTPDDAYVDFKYYKAQGVHAAGEAFDLLRNYWYSFNLSQGPLDLTVYVDVQPYAKVELDPNFGLERDEEGYIIVRNRKGEVIKYIRTDGAELTLGDVYMPFYGTIRAVFDSRRRALLGFLLDGRQVFWNYDGEDQSTAKMTSWEIYSKATDKIDTHLDEDYIKIPATGSGVQPFTQSFYDDKGRVIERYVYPSNDIFENREIDGQGALKTVSYTGSKYGAKVITYSDEKGTAYCTVTVTVNPDGTETEAYK